MFPGTFMGTFEPRLDDKGRLFLPAVYRAEFTEGAVLVRGQERAVYIYPKATFGVTAQQVKALPSTDKAARTFSRMVLSGAFPQIPDKQGRVTIPAHLREYGRLERDLAVVGAGDRLEVWRADAWATWLAEQEPGFADLEGAVRSSDF